jgi:7-carboxy-7-deazaguanine synthase
MARHLAPGHPPPPSASCPRVHPSAFSLLPSVFCQRSSSIRCRAKASRPVAPRCSAGSPGCNLWTGREQDRATAVCTFCDTDFVGIGPDGGRSSRPPMRSRRCGGCAVAGSGVGARRRGLHWRGAAPPARRGCDRRPPRARLRGRRGDQRHPAPSPRARLGLREPQGRRPVVVAGGDELKLVFPQAAARPERFEGLAFRHFLQPMDGPDREANTRAAVDYCLAHPRWRLSVQTHKVVGVR